MSEAHRRGEAGPDVKNPSQPLGVVMPVVERGAKSWNGRGTHSRRLTSNGTAPPPVRGDPPGPTTQWRRGAWIQAAITLVVTSTSPL